ncbi:MAG: globin [Sulfuricurvum sp.]|uniref:globin domain-containing protein n=1 Tax=Sulfuricurvum sp. TaxID=2025608 RepID=UPI0026066A1E|nr:globin [Sulfuricurvum sp.]MDD2830239.1 globin [Sulfuricurvum sp.]MDD4948803.1 globin [Sulfuricurvum sp.]
MSEHEHKSNSCQNGRITSFTQLAQMEQQPNKPRFGGENIRVVDAMIDIIFPPVPFPSNKIFNALGEVKIREMVWHHHKLLLKTKVGDLFPRNEEALKMAIDKSADFFVEALGGDQIFTEQHGEPHLRMRHFKIPIDENDREIWLAMYKKTLKELAFPQEHLQEFWNWIEPLSIRMINRRTNMEAIKRHHWADVEKELLKSGE